VNIKILELPLYLSDLFFLHLKRQRRGFSAAIFLKIGGKILLDAGFSKHF
jgi:hypothetical protein